MSFTQSSCKARLLVPVVVGMETEFCSPGALAPSPRFPREAPSLLHPSSAPNLVVLPRSGKILVRIPEDERLETAAWCFVLGLILGAMLLAFLVADKAL